MWFHALILIREWSDLPMDIHQYVDMHDNHYPTSLLHALTMLKFILHGTFSGTWQFIFMIKFQIHFSDLCRVNEDFNVPQHSCIFGSLFWKFRNVNIIIPSNKHDNTYILNILSCLCCDLHISVSLLAILIQLTFLWTALRKHNNAHIILHWH